MPRSVRVVAICLLVLSSRTASAGDAFLKASLLFEPREAHLSDRWFVHFGSDYPLNLGETAFLGFELQTALYRVPAPAGMAHVAPANGFFNAKYKAPTYGVRPYAGGGVGLLSSFTFLEGDRQWDRDTGFHLLGGIELGGATLELQALRSFDEGAEFAYLLLFGFVW